MADYLIADRYAGALSAAIEDNAQLTPALVSLEELAEAIRTHHDLHSCLSNPAIQVDNRKKVLDEFLVKMTVIDQVKQLCHVLLERGRIGILPEVAQVFQRYVDERLNQVTAWVSSALPLNEAQEAQLKTSLTRQSGKTVQLRCSVDPDLIGGVVAKIGGKVFDGSLRTRLANLKKVLTAGEVS